MAGDLQRHRGTDRRGTAGAGRPPGQRPERVLSPFPFVGSRTGALRELGVAFIPWSPLGGIGRPITDRARAPRRSPRWPAEVGTTPEKVTLAWMLAKGSRVSPSPEAVDRDGDRLGRRGGHRADPRAGGDASTLPELAEQNRDAPRRWMMLLRASTEPRRSSTMPAVTVPDNLTLPASAVAGPGAQVRAVRSITDAPSGFEGEGFPVRRAFAGVSLSDLDPVHPHGSDGRGRVRAGRAQGHAMAPHRGFETVTYMIDGTFQHQDSIGGGGLITNGSTQWMTAGSGILHIERPPEQLIATGGLFHGIQLWVNLPGGREVGRPALPEPRSAGRRAPELARRRSTRARHRRRRGRPPRARLDAHAHLPRPCHGATRR